VRAKIAKTPVNVFDFEYRRKGAMCGIVARIRGLKVATYTPKIEAEVFGNDLTSRGWPE
jgi:hypothetical protein